MAFDIEGARKAGYSDTEIADYLGQENGFDTAAALKSGYTPDEIIGHLTAAPSASSTSEPAPEKSFLSSVGDNFTSLVKGVAATNPVIGRALTVAQGPQPKKLNSVLEGQQMPDVPFDSAEAERLSRRDYAQEVETRERQAKSPVFKEQRAPILNDRQAFAERNPITAGFAQSAAQTLAGTLNVPSVITGLAGETINRQAGAMGFEPVAGRVSNMPLVDDLKSIAQDYASQLSRKSPNKAWDDGDFGRWMMTQLAGNSFSAAQSLGALFVPGAQASLLASMGGIAAGNAYAEGDTASAATMKGLVEVGSEMLPLHAAEKIKDLVLKIPTPVRGAVLADAGKRLLAAGTAVTTNSMVGAIEEAAAEVGGNAIDKYISGKDKSLFEDVDRAAIVGAAFGTAFSGPAIAETMSSPRARAARELASELRAPEAIPVETSVMEALRTGQGNTANIDPVATTLAAAAGRKVEQERAIADIGNAQSVDQAIEAAQRAVSVPVESTEAIAQRIREIEQQQTPVPQIEPSVQDAVADVEVTRDGSLRVIGDTQVLTGELEKAGVANVIPTESGVIVGPAQAAEAQTVLQGVASGARNGSVASPQIAEIARASEQGRGAFDAGIPQRPQGGSPGVAELAVPQDMATAGEPANAQSALARPLSPELLKTYSAPSTKQQTVASQLEARVRATYPDATFQAVGVPSGRSGKSMQEAADTARRLFGIDVNYVKFDGSPLFDGVRSDAFPNTIFIRADAPKPHMAILGHELLHEMRGTSPELYAELSSALDALVKNDSQYADVLRRRYESQGGKLPAEWREELHADIVGDNFADPQFWSDLSREKPGMFERLANAVRQFLNRILLKAKPFGSDAYLNDIKAARDVVSSAVQKFSDSRVRGTAFSVDSTQAQAQNEAYAGNINTPRAGERAVDTDGYRPASTVHQQLADQLLSRVQRAYPNAQFHAVDAPEGVRGQSLIAARTTGKRLFRQDVVFVQFDGPPLFNGAVSDAIPGVVFVRADTDKPHMSVLGHELLHQLRKETPDLYDQLASRLGKMVENESAYAAQLASRYEKQGGQLPKEWREELYADIVGDNFSNPDFWEAMAKDQPGLFQRVAEAIRKFLDNVLTRAEPFATGQYLRDVKAARDAVADAMRQFSGTQVGALTSQVDGVAMSVASKEAQTLKDVVREIESTGIRMDAFESRGRINLNRIVVPQEARNSGAGTKAMNDLVRYADASGQTIALTPSSDFGGNKNRLVDFYKRFGFVENKGRNKDFEISESMYRLPQTKMSVASQEREYPLAPPGQRYEETSSPITMMTPDEFLSRVRPLTMDEESRDSIDALKEHIESGRMLDPLHIYANGKEDGRHRAYAAKELGIKRVPVVDEQSRVSMSVAEDNTNSNSQPIASTPEALENFRKWFGDSKVVDAEGRPLVVYHGTRSSFDTVDMGETRRLPGFWLTPDPALASIYAAEGIRNPARYPTGSNVMPLYARIENPYVFNPKKLSFQSAWDEYQSGDYDGLIEHGNDTANVTTLVVKSRAQIKSATGNQGTYDPSNPDIRYSIADNSESRDEKYMDAIANGDMDAAQKMVDAAARAAGYVTGDEYRMSHRAPNSEDDVSLMDVRGADLVPDDYWTHPQWYQGTAEERSAFNNVLAAMRRDDARVASGRSPGYAGITVYRAVPKTVKDNDVRNGDWVSPSLEYAKAEGAMIPEGYRIISQQALLKNLYWDGNSIAELGYDDGRSYAYKNTKNNRKLTDVVTRDDDGNIIPLSKRFNARKDDVRYSLSDSETWATPEESRIDQMIYEMQDSRVDLKRVQESIKDFGKQIEEKFDARQAESLYPGRVAYRSEQFLKGEVKPLLQAMALNKVSMNELADYLHARGAKERNAQIARINPDMPDGGAGTNTQGVLMTNKAAQDYLDSIPADRRKQLDSLAEKVDAITKGTRELLVREGLEKPEVIQAWEAAYKNYVPMFRDEAESGNPHTSGGGFSVRGGNSKRATGSTKEVTNILAHVLMQREAAITKAEKNRVGLALYGLALTNPNTDFWATIRPGMQVSQIASELKAMGVDPLVAEAGMQGVPTIRTVDPILDRVVDRPNPMYKSLPGALTVKVDGEDRVLMFNEKDQRALRLAESLKNMDGLTRFDLASSIIGKTTRWMAAVNTQYNPAFGIVNGIRDTFGGAVNLTSTPLRGKSSQVLLDAYTKAGPAIAKELAKPGGQGDWAKLYRQFQEDGGKTGYREIFKDANDRSKAIENELKLLEKAGKLTPRKAAGAMLDLLDGFNTTIENAVRLSAYKTALDQGLSRPAAAKIARELTVDFNRKGRAGRELGPLYAFFNASVQGTARTVEAIKGPAGAKIIAGGLALGALQTLLMALTGFDDDEIPEFIKTRAFIIPLPGTEKKFIAVPLPLGLHVIPNTGRVISELAMNGGKDIGKRTFEAIGEVAGAFNPLGGGNVFTADGALRTVAPTILDPIIEIGFNKNFAGSQIERGERGETDVRPGFARAKESTQRALTGQAYLGISKAINKLSGGTDYEAGMVSPTPERLQYLAQVAGGGLLRELEKTINLTDASLQGDEIKQNKIPVVGRLFGQVDEDAVNKSRYFEASKKFDKLQAGLKAAQKAGDADAVRKMLDSNPELMLGPTQDRIAQQIAKLNKVAALTINDREQLKQLDEVRLAYMKNLNEAIKKQEEQSGKKTPGQKLRDIVKSKREGMTSGAAQ